MSQHNPQKNSFGKVALRRLGWGMLAIALSRAVAIAAEPSIPSTISVEDLANRKVTVIGDLGVPLGTLVEVEATIVGRGTSKMSADSYRLRVESVNRRALPNPPEMKFSAHWVPSRATLPATTSELAEQQLGKRSPWTNEDLEKWERNFVGSRHTLLAYEEASFAGIPKNPDKFPTISYAWYGFHFSSLLVVVDEFPRVALETPGSAKTVGVSALAAPMPLMADDTEKERRWLAQTFLSSPQVFRHAHLRVADHMQDLVTYRTELVTKARLHGWDGEALERCIEAALERNFQDAVAIPIAAVVAEREGEDIWLITWAFGPMNETSDGATAASATSELSGRWTGRLRSVAIQGYRMRDGVACTFAATSEQ